MKKSILKMVAAAMVVTVAGYGVYQNQIGKIEMSEMALANVEALARGELPGVTVTCGIKGGACWIISGDCYIDWFNHTHDCSFCGYQSISCTSPCFYLD